MNSAVPGRFSTLFRWLGLTLVLLLALQLLAVLSVNGWGEETFRQLVATTLVSQSSMAFVGLLLMLVAARLEDPAPGRTPLKWFVAVLSGLLALALLLTLPVTIGADRALSDKANEALMAQKGQLAMARAQLQNPQLIEQVIAQAEQAGQLSPTATAAQKQTFAKGFMDSQLRQADDQIRQAERRRDLALNQRRIGGIGTAVVMLVGFALLGLVAVL